MSKPLRDIGNDAEQPAAVNASASSREAFPQDPAEFESDPRVSYSRLEGKWILEKNGGEWQYDEQLRRWIPTLDEQLLQQQQLAYKREDVDENEPAAPGNKRKQTGDNQVNNQGPSKKQKAPKAERKNTAVYVTSLPLNVEVDEINRIFSRCGVISEEIESGKPRIKLYTADDGSFKGDALIVYFRPESVQLAVQMLDDSDFRFGEEGPAGKMRVKEADYSYKKHKDDQEDSSKPADAKEAPHRGGMTRDKKKIIKKTEKMNARLADWSDDEDPQTLTQQSSRFDKVVVLKHMFTLAELDEDAGAILDIKQDIRDECSKLGGVTNVVLFDREEQGIATVRFADAQAARACVSLMDGRAFDGRRVEASISDGSERFRKTDDKSGAKGGDQGQKVNGDEHEGDAVNEQDRQEGERMAQFGDWLEADASSGGKGTGAHKDNAKEVHV